MKPSLLARGSRWSRNSHILTIKALSVTLTMKLENQFLCITLWFIMNYHHTKFDNTILGGSEDITQTKHSLTYFHPFLWPWPWTEQQNFSTGHLCVHRTLAYADVPSNQVWKRNSSLEDRKSHFDYINPCCDFDLQHSKPIFSAWHSSSYINIPSLVTKSWADQETSSGKKIWTPGHSDSNIPPPWDGVCVCGGGEV